MRVFFVDTNLFLQCRALDELPWSEIANGHNIRLLVARAVQKEIDDLKADGNARRAKRARKATTLFRDILTSGSTTRVVRESNPRVVLEFSPVENPGKIASQKLDLTLNDDRIINEAILYKSNHSQDSVHLLTNDTHLMRTAQFCGLEFTAIPEEWELPPESDRRDKELSKLKDKIKTLEYTYPRVDIKFCGSEDEELNELTIDLTTFADLSTLNLEMLVEAARDNHPMVEKFDTSSTVPSQSSRQGGILGLGMFDTLYEYIPPTEKAIEKYQTEDYPKWLGDVRSFFADLPRRLESPFRSVHLCVEIGNKGNVPADNVLVEFHALGGVLFEPPDFDSEKGTAINPKDAFPQPPIPPQTKCIPEGLLSSARNLHTMFSSMSDMGSGASMFNLPNLDPIEPHDRNAFYRKEKPSGFSDFWSFSCSEFRHKANPELFKMSILVPRDKPISSGAIKCIVSAANLPDPKEVIIPVNIRCTPGDTEDKAWGILNDI